MVSSKWFNATSGLNGSATAWALVDSQFSPIWVVGREEKKTTIWTDNKNKNVVYDIMCRYQFGNKDWRGFWRSAGAGAAYSS